MKGEETAVFKSYLRRLIQDLKDIRECIETGDRQKAEELIEKLIIDTQNDIDDK